MTADDGGLTGLWFVGQKYFDSDKLQNCVEKETPVFADVRRWLDLYFDGKNPNFDLPLQFVGTEFQKRVWQILCQIPYGQTVTYGEIAKTLAKDLGVAKMSAQAVGGAVGHNKISVIVPCHRVVGADGSLTGYAGGVDRKIALLKLENAFKDSFYLPKV